ncbi:hypothetical protein BD626DRAFT_181592 [Schizophyllum amplum]|uniref:Uncharacterized protein n=1 Tax=Schizophyllum amplum TaxID=97359 RepID=A0A550C1F3_9AGAR|nr:hypothetical protein BD626DRAFT_181592 [Auriculariopsis ampla]
MTTQAPETTSSTAAPTRPTVDGAPVGTTTTTTATTSEPSEKARAQDAQAQVPPTGFAHRYLPRFVPFFAAAQRPRAKRDPRSLREKAKDTPDSEDYTRPTTPTEKAGQTFYVIRPEPPALHFKFKPRNPILYFLFLVLCNVVLPVLLFYPLINFTPLELRDVVGISSSALGLSSCFDAPMRLWKLTKHRTSFGPLNSTKWYHLDFSMWFYSTAMMVFAIPLIIAPIAPVYDMFNMATVMLILPAGLMMALSIIPLSPRLENWRRAIVPLSLTSDGVVKVAPLRTDVITPAATAPSDTTSATHIESPRVQTTSHFYEAFNDDEDPNNGHAPYTAVDAEHAAPYTTRYLPSEEDPDDTSVKPAMFYIIEDIVAVDFGYRRPWRRRLRARWRASPPFREHMRRQTAYWVFASIIHAGVTSAVTWGASFRFAFGWNLGMFFAWALLAGYCSWLLAQHELQNEHTWWVDRERALWADARTRALAAEAQPHRMTSDRSVPPRQEKTLAGATARGEGTNAVGEGVEGIEIVNEPEGMPASEPAHPQPRFSEHAGRPPLHDERSEPDAMEVVGVRDHHGRLRAAQREAGAPDAPGVVRMNEHRSRSQRRKSEGGGLRRQSEGRGKSSGRGSGEMDRRHSDKGPGRVTSPVRHTSNT